MKTNKKLKTIALSLGLAAAMLPVANVSAQGVFGDLLDNYYDELDRGNGRSMLMRESRDGGSGNSFSISTEQFGGSEGGGTGGFNIGTEQFGTPLGSGLFIMAAAGAAYAFSKKRKNQENNQKQND
jgi:hypothetical protein